MIHAYNELYLDNAMQTLAETFSFVKNEKEADVLFEHFLMSGIAIQFSKGNPKYINMPSHALFNEIVDGKMKLTMPNSNDRSKEYWCGYVLAFYQWYRDSRFSEMNQWISIEDILRMYDKYHEMDIMNFIEEMNRRFTSIKDETKLKKMRTYNSLSQSELAAKSGVSKRIIQLYEQRVNDINKAAAHTVYKLARALHCTVEELLEDPMFTK